MANDPAIPEEPPVPEPAAAAEDEPVDDYGPPFEPKTFGGAFVWARAPSYTASVLRVRDGENVVVSTRNRRDMTIMLTGGRALLEVHDGTEVDRVELLPASPVEIPPGRDYRLLALTEVELFTIFTPLPPAE